MPEGLGFVLKKIISRLLFPLGLTLILTLLGMIIWRRWPERRLGPALVAGSWLLLLLLSLPLTGYWLMLPLEQAAGDYADPAFLRESGVRQVVVLGGGVTQGARTPADQLKPATAQRVLEAVRLWRALPGARLVLSGGNYEEGLSEAQAMAGLARELGVPAADMVLETDSWDTGDQAALLRGMLGQEPLALVTSAYHMRRSLWLFRSAGLKALPAPTEFICRGFSFDYNTMLPQTGGLHLSETAIYEYLGWWWYQLKALWPRPTAPQTRPAAS